MKEKRVNGETTWRCHQNAVSVVEQANDNSIKSLSQSYSTFISTSPAFLEIINPEIKLQLLNKKIQLKI